MNLDGLDSQGLLWMYTLFLLNAYTTSCIFQVIADPSLSLKQRSFITDAARALDKAKMMRFDEKSGNFYCTELGRIASHFYIQYSSVETYNEMLRRHMNDSEVIPNFEIAVDISLIGGLVY